MSPWLSSPRVIDCSGCKKKRRLHARELCHACYQRRLCVKIIDDLEKNLKPASEYNRQLFTLYVSYTRRLETQCSMVWGQAKRLAKFLEQTPIPPIQDWATVDAYSRSMRFGYNSASRGRKNCAWLRIGHRLQEIGVLPNLQHEQSIAIKNHLGAFDEKTRLILRKYIAVFFRQKRLPKTVVLNLVSLKFLYAFLKKKDPCLDLLTLTPKLFEEFLDHERSRFENPLTMNPRFYHLKRFYRWAKLERLILMDPCAQFTPPEKSPSVCVCSDEQIKKIIAWMKNPKSDSRYAMVLALTLFYGFTARDIVSAKVEVRKDLLCLRLPQSIGPFRRRSFRTAPILILPKTPEWFFKLQKRFYADWRAHRDQLRTPDPVPWLVLSGNARTDNPSSYSLIRKWIKVATVAATGQDIPIRFIRQSCGHIYSTDSDASILSRFGWAPSTAYKYVWSPRVLYSRPAKSSRT